MDEISEVSGSNSIPTTIPPTPLLQGLKDSYTHRPRIVTTAAIWMLVIWLPLFVLLLDYICKNNYYIRFPLDIATICWSLVECPLCVCKVALAIQLLRQIPNAIQLTLNLAALDYLLTTIYLIFYVILWPANIFKVPMIYPIGMDITYIVLTIPPTIMLLAYKIVQRRRKKV